MLIKTFPVGAFQCNCTIVADPVSREAFVIDPGDEAERILKELAAQQIHVRKIVHTHAHIDHIGATKAIAQKTGGEICLHKDDLFLYDNMAMQAEVLGVSMDCDVLAVQKFITHGDVLEASPQLRADVLHTPGHTPGSVCFLIGNTLFAGDTLFHGSIGRTDLWGGDYGQIIASIKEKLLTLPVETRVICGHGPHTTIGSEAKNNPFLM